jgi:peptide/nickel transport system permease protein
MSRTGILLLSALYGAALLAGFIAPYAPTEEFRDHFFHPPSKIHFQDSSGRWTWPYVNSTYLIDQSNHIFLEGIPLYISIAVPERNENPYFPELIENMSIILRTPGGQVLGKISTLKETGENTGIFTGMTAIQSPEITSVMVEANGKQTLLPENASSQIFLSDESGNRVSRIASRVMSHQLAFFSAGSPYRLFGLIHTRIHLFGADKPGTLFLLGTDQSGRDIFSRILYGARISLTAGLIGVLLTSILGWWIGGCAGYLGGKIDTVIMRLADVVMAIPTLYLILAVRNVFPLHLASEVSYFLIILVLSSTGWAVLSRVIRGMVLSLREEQFILAAKAQGASLSRIFFRHIVPNTAGYVIVRSTLLIPAYILAEVTLSFLGVGIQEPTPSWGNMLTAAQDLRVLTQFPWTLAPALFLLLALLGFNFLGEGLRKKLSVRPII